MHYRNSDGDGVAANCPNCERNRSLAAQVRGLADAILVGGLTSVGVPASIAAAAPTVVESAALKAAGKPRAKNGWNQFLSRYVDNYRRKHPKGRKTFGALSKEAARKVEEDEQMRKRNTHTKRSIDLANDRTSTFSIVQRIVDKELQGH